MQHRLYFPNLDALRAMACTCGIFQHTFYWYWSRLNEKSWWLGHFVHAISYGELALFFFFMLSGFLITYLMLEEKSRTGNFSIPKFYVRRILRVWPLFFTIIILALCISLISPQTFGLPDKPIEKLWTYFVFIGNFDVIRCTVDGMKTMANDSLRVTWSLAVEEQFYLLWPLLFFVLRKNFVWLIVAIALGTYAIKIDHMHDKVFYFHSFYSFFFIALGALTGLLAHSQRQWVNFTFKRWHFVVNYMVMGVVLFLSPEIEAYFGGSRLIVETVMAFGFALMMLEQSVHEKPLVQFGRVPGFAQMGRFTYGMYLYHPLVIYMWIGFVRWEFTRVWQPFLYGIIIWLVAAGVAWVSYRYMEKPLLRLKDRFASVVSGSSN